MAEGYRTFDHTGDLGLEVWAETPERLHALAALALMAQIARPRAADAEGNPDPAEVVARLELEGDDAGDVLVHWLNTALLESELQHALWTRASVERLTPCAIVGTLEGPRLDPGRQVFLREIKAVSHHFLALDLEPGACRCRLVLDL